MSDGAMRTYKKLHRDAQAVAGADFSVPLHVGDPRDFPAPRNMAFCAYRDGNAGREVFIVVAPKLLRGDSARVEAVLRHELAHALEFHLGKAQLRRMARVDGYNLPSTPERRADAVAEIIWGDPIYYDRMTVQTLSPGRRPRPTSLPK